MPRTPERELVERARTYLEAAGINLLRSAYTVPVLAALIVADAIDRNTAALVDGPMPGVTDDDDEASHG